MTEIGKSNVQGHRPIQRGLEGAKGPFLSSLQSTMDPVPTRLSDIWGEWQSTIGDIGYQLKELVLEIMEINKN